jgi:hypothetical protein
MYRSASSAELGMIDLIGEHAAGLPKNDCADCGERTERLGAKGRRQGARPFDRTRKGCRCNDESWDAPPSDPSSIPLGHCMRGSSVRPGPGHITIASRTRLVQFLDGECPGLGRRQLQQLTGRWGLSRWACRSICAQGGSHLSCQPRLRASANCASDADHGPTTGAPGTSDRADQRSDGVPERRRG